MPEITYYVALPFIASDDGIAPAEATECFNPNAAVMRTEALSRKPGYVGAVGVQPDRRSSDRRLRRREGDQEVWRSA